MGGPGNKSEEGGGVTKLGKTTINLNQSVKMLGIPSTPIAKKTAGFLRMKDGSLEKTVMEDVIRHGGGSIGAIRLRLATGGLPRNKLLDIKNVFKSLHDHGYIELTGIFGNRIKGSDLSDEQRVTTKITQDYVNSMRSAPPALISALASLNDNNTKNKKS